MRWKKIAKRLLIVTGSLVVLGGLAFGTFVYNPFEGSVDEIRKAVPTTVDFYVAKRDLRTDFVDFPEPHFWGSVVTAPWWSRLTAGPAFREHSRSIERALAQIDEIQAQLGRVPVLGADILSDLIGEDLAVAGRLRADGRSFDICAYSRVSWKIRAAIELLRYEFVRSRAGAARITLEQEELYRIEVAGAEPLFVTRVKDLAIAGNQLELVKTSRDLALGISEGDVMYASADYNDDLRANLEDWSERADRAANAIESMVDVGMLRRRFPEFAAWPARPNEATMEVRVLDTFINQNAMRRLWTSFVFEEPAGLAALMNLSVNHGQLKEFQKRFHNEQPGDVERWLVPFLNHVPHTAAIAAALRVPPGAFLTEMYHLLERDAQDLLEEGFRRSGVKGGPRALLDMVAPGLEPWVGIVFRNNDYPVYNREFEVAIPSPAAAFALVFAASRGEEKRVEGLIKSFEDKWRHNLDFKEKMFIPVGPGRKENRRLIREFGNRHIPATGEIALYFDGEDRPRYFIVSNSGKLVQEIIDTRYRPAAHTPLSRTDDVSEVLGSLPEKVSGFLWAQGERCRHIVARYQQFFRRAMDDEAMDQGWAVSARGRVEDEIFERHFGSRYGSKAQLRGADAKRFDELVQKRLSEMWAQERVKLGKDLDRRLSEAGSWLDYMEAACLVLRARPKDLRLTARIFPRW